MPGPTFKFILATLIGGALTLSVFLFVFITRSDPRDVAGALKREIDQVARPTLVTDRHGKRLGEFSEEARYPIKLKDVPLPVRRAFLAAEDADFYRHRGVSWKGLLRSLLINIRRERLAQGGSTITQQLVRQYLLTRDRAVSRKLREIYLAVLLERQLSKDEIFELWLNGVYLGNNAWGLEAASQHYFRKTAKALTVGEAAVLAGLPQAPSRYAPHLHPGAAKLRKKYVIRRMEAAGWLDARAAKRWVSEPVTVYRDRSAVSTAAPWVTEAARLELWRRLELKGLPRSGLVVETTVDRDWQLQAQKLIARDLLPFRSQGLEASFAAVDIASGEVLALVGGTDFKQSQFNRATMLARPYGSATFPIIYAWALDAGAGLIPGWQNLGSTAIVNQFLDGDRAASLLGYGEVKDRFLQLNMRVKNEDTIEQVTGSPLALAQAWRVVSGRPLTQARRIIRSITGPDGRALALPEAKSTNAGVSEVVSYTVKEWLKASREAPPATQALRFASDIAWNHWEIAVTDGVVAVIWVGVDQRPTRDPDGFRRMANLSGKLLNEWLKSTGTDVGRPVGPPPSGLSWNLHRSKGGRTQYIPFPTVLQ